MIALGQIFEIKTLTTIASKRLTNVLSQYRAHGKELGFALSYFRDFLFEIKRCWDLPFSSYYCDHSIHNQFTVYMQTEINDWAKVEGPQPRFLESAYRRFFCELEQPEKDFATLRKEIEDKYWEYRYRESGVKRVVVEDESSDEGHYE